MTIARADLWDTICPEKFISTTLNWNILDYSSYPYVVNLTLGYDCFGPPPGHPVEERSHFQCQVGAGGQSSNINFFVNESYESIIQQNCKGRIKVPVFQEVLDAFWGNNTITVQELVKQGFGVEYHYMDYFRNCVLCYDSGGECGSDITTNQAICFCHDGHQPQTCPGPGPEPGVGKYRNLSHISNTEKPILVLEPILTRKDKYRIKHKIY
ncbi:LEAF RUST 10 DISEASE-RESISTANCE LOCUS RECEPTOR-LIKE PROTEIN KINASE-like 2.1 [Camellia lanceoleosa]|uniref:LEAF RUST 10 DISEASE-RESISTANCE LOCUS RECEPTOR-LIKE PROTEIN KINASE-like 2.1 n=1 Tax=Camellia lanceoleosa TaxID=1840588 RepID=A0ACC0FD99_9ERIC|nr:LEAF RUST 10 DISEASE-RESISTANCE LOCUS RECEPTOR-LIKE PROTEIN KINASE-like 2.1 [Camellia lanceoleosa]